MPGALAWVGLGSNLEQPQRQLSRALQALSELPASTLLAVSAFYRSAALVAPGGAAQPDYCNAVAALRTRLAPDALLAQLLQIEQAQGRERSASARWQARTLDLDLLACGQQQCAEPSLLLPHPQLGRRRFVLQPWCDLAPDCRPPGQPAMRTMLAASGDAPLRPWSDS